MADHLDRLAARAVGGGSGVVPRLRGRYEPETGAMSDVDIVETGGPAAGPGSPATVGPPSSGPDHTGPGSWAAAAGATPAATTPSGPVRSGPARLDRAPLDRAPRDPAAHRLPVAAPLLAATSGQVDRPVVDPPPGSDRAAPSSSAVPPAQASPVRPLTTLALPSSPSGPALRPLPPAVPGPAPSTVVRISIGRIEVRAAVAPPPPPAPPRPARPAPPVRSLTDYVNGDDGRPA